MSKNDFILLQKVVKYAQRLQHHYSLLTQKEEDNPNISLTLTDSVNNTQQDTMDRLQQ